MASQGDASGPVSDERGEILFAAAVEALDEGILVQDPRGKVLRANTSAAAILGIEAGRFRDLADPSNGWRAIREDGSELDPAELPGARTSESGEPNRGAIVGVRSPEGDTTWLSINAYPIDLDDERLVVSSFTDITAARDTTEALRDSEERTRAILDTAAEGILTTDEGGIVLDLNPAAGRILGADAVGRPLADLVVDAERWAVTEHFAGPPSGHPSTPAAIERTFQRDDGTTVPTELAISETPTRDGRLFTCVLHDISERKAFERELEHQATHDPLTGLPNRALVIAELDTALVRRARRARGVGVLFVELGRMSVVTESLGHAAADHIVLDAVERLRAAIGAVLPEETTIARWGGEHLVVVVEDLDDVTRLVSAAADVIGRLDDPYLVGSEEALVRPTVGIAYAAGDDTTAEAMITDAGIAMNRAAARGGGYEVFDAEMRRWVDSRRTLEVALRRGIDRGELELYYQPVVEVRSGTVKGFEALVRWNHPELGLLLPGSFIPLAEDCGLIIPLGEQLMADACEQLAAWQRGFPTLDLTVSVNLSGVQLARADLAATVCGSLTSAGTDPRGLHLELTETVLLDDVETAAATLDELKALGVGLALDDFGTGYSSLKYLCRFPIDVLKVDQSFVSQLGTGTRDASMVSVVVGMAEALSMAVVAEGIETTEQLEALRSLDCPYAQGFLFSEARPAHEAEHLLTLTEAGTDGW